MRETLAFLRWLWRDARARFAHERVWVEGLRKAAGVRIVAPHRLTAAGGVYVDHGAYLHCGDQAWCEGAGGISIGRGSYLGPYCVLFGMGGIEIGEQVMIAPGAVLSSVQHPWRDASRPMYEQPRVYGKIAIEDDVYVGSNAVVTPGVRVGRGAVIGAGAVVTRDVPAWALAVGVPARVVGQRGGQRGRSSDRRDIQIRGRGSAGEESECLEDLKTVPESVPEGEDPKTVPETG
jgi:acetyltransferase-like isoleucine patch superfamily enzyme